MSENHKEEKDGHINLILGPMCSGKSSELLRIAKRCSLAFPVLYINSKRDTRRFSPTDSNVRDISTHDPTISGPECAKLPITYIRVDNLEDIQPDELIKYKIICIDEGHFYPTIVESIKMMADVYKIDVYVAGLNCSYKRLAIGDILHLVPLADEIIVLKAICIPCSTKGKYINAPFTHSLIVMDTDIHAGGLEEFIPVCRRCFLELN